jgi:hypothetical protein
VLLEHCPHPSEQQSQSAERRSVQKKCEKSRLGGKSMKFVVIVALICFGLNHGYAEYCMNCDCQKHYISVEQIVVAEDGLFVIVNGESLPVTYVAHDSNGYYCAKFHWTCPRCQTVNEWWRTKCKHCGY